MAKATPVILDTDIGWDIDDTWAVAMMLNSPELDVKMILTAYGNTPLRARVAGKLLEAAGRTDIPIGIGLCQNDDANMQDEWVGGYDLDHYPGSVHQDGVGALVNALMASPEPITIVGIAPVTNIAAALSMEPRIVEHARFVGMLGSIRLGYGAAPGPAAEANVASDVSACRRVFEAPWDITIAPLDSCGIVALHDDRYAKVRDAGTPLTAALMENVRIWGRTIHPEWRNGLNVETDSSTLFDTVAVYLAFSDELLKIEEMGIRVGDDGLTFIDPKARRLRCATGWKDLAAFEDLLVARLAGAKA
jgi:inosine-uridine nucleoside N-ribohydrolase